MGCRARSQSRRDVHKAFTLAEHTVGVIGRDPNRRFPLYRDEKKPFARGSASSCGGVRREFEILPEIAVVSSYECVALGEDRFRALR